MKKKSLNGYAFKNWQELFEAREINLSLPPIFTEDSRDVNKDIVKLRITISEIPLKRGRR